MLPGGARIYQQDLQHVFSGLDLYYMQILRNLSERQVREDLFLDDLL